MLRGYYRGAVWTSAVLVGCLVGSAAFADPDVAAIVKNLAASNASPVVAGGGCAVKLPDGTCPDEPTSRQLVILPRGANAAAKVRRVSMPAAKPYRQDISMTFEKGSAELTPHARAILDRLATALKTVPNYRPFQIDGHTDKSGSRELNLTLSQARAQAVVDYLASKGVDQSHMKAIGYGYDRPLPGVSADQPANRRVELAAF